MSTKAKGSFRGVPFRTVSAATRVGRRQQLYSLPFQDDGVLGVDLGRAPQRYSLTICLIADDGDLTTQLKAMTEALETTGPGLLIHPDPAIGRKNVRIGDDIDVNTNVEKGRVVEISFKAVEAAEKPQGGPSLDSASSLLNAIDKARSAASISFSNPITGLQHAVSDFVAAAHLSVLDDVLNDMRAINGAINSVLALPGQLAEQIDSISRELENLLNAPANLFKALDDALTLMGNAVTRIVGKDGTEQDVVDVALAPLNRTRGSRGSLFGSIGPMAILGSKAPEVPDIDTADRRAQRHGQLAIQRHFRASGLLALSKASTKSRFDTSRDAIAVRNLLSKKLLELSDTEPDLDTNLADALRDVAASLIRHLTLVAGSAADVTRFAPADTLPIEVIAHSLYGDAKRSDEIAARNPQIAHPSMVPGKTEIEVLTV